MSRFILRTLSCREYHLCSSLRLLIAEFTDAGRALLRGIEIALDEADVYSLLIFTTLR